MPSKRRTNAAAKGARGRQQGGGGRRKAAVAQAPRSAQANDIIGVILIAIAAAMAVALLVPTSAPVTQAAGSFLSLCFGRGALLVPLALTLFAITFFLDQYGPLPTHVAAGLLLIVTAILSLMSLTCPGAEAEPDLVLVNEELLARGGYVGGGIAWGLLRTVGFGVGMVVLLGVILVGLIICGFSISGAITKMRTKASAVSAERQVARDRRRQEREQRAAEREAARELEASDLQVPSPQAAAPKTSALGERKTTVLRRNLPADRQEEPVEEEPRTRLLSRLGRDRKHTDTQRLGATLLGAEDTGLGDEDEDAATPAAVPEDVHTTLLPRSKARGKARRTEPDEAQEGVDEPAATKKPQGSPSIPDFLRQQAEEQRATAAKGGEAPHADGKKARPASRPAPTSLTAATGAIKASEDEDGYQLPPLSMLAANPHSAEAASSGEELESTRRRLQATLEEFGLTSRVVDYVSGPLVTTFQVEMGEGERVNRIVNLEDDIALTLAAESVRIFAPIPGTSRVGIEIPNKKRSNVCLGDVLPYAKGGPLEFAVGRDSEGKPVIADLAKMPHLLVAGATGSGKSVMINSLIMSILMRDTPKQVRLILVDPKRVEFSGYNGLPHLYVPVVTEPRQAASALQWAVSEMERRLKVFERAGARNIGVYNQMCVSGKLSEMDNPPEPMPFMVIIIDELSDLMMVAGKDVEASIVRIAQLARAAGIHLVLATQRPSADVVTGLIKSNIETRIALSVASSTDSRVIIDQTGAQRLLGNGDMLFKFRGQRTRRILGCYVSDQEIETVVDYVRGQAEPDYHEEILTQIAPNDPRGGSGGSADNDDDPLVWEAAQIVVESQLGSTSGLQRRLKVGYARAGRIMDMLEAKGVVGPPDGSKPREVLLDMDGLEELRSAEEKYREV